MWFPGSLSKNALAAMSEVENEALNVEARRLTPPWKQAAGRNIGCPSRPLAARQTETALSWLRFGWRAIDP